MTVPLTCLCFLIDDSAIRPPRVLLGRKRRGLGEGKVVGLGGHLEPGEDARAAAVREVEEEAGCLVLADVLRAAATLSFRFPERPAWDMDVEVFTAARWKGEPATSDEIVPIWYAVDALPLDEMWDDARYWLPHVLAGRSLAAHFTFGPDNHTVLEQDVRRH